MRSPSHSPGRRLQGFTLVEVMIVVALLGILTAIALPSYNSYVQKSRRSDARAALMDAANRQQQFILNRSTFTTNMQDLGYATDPARSPDGFYTIDAAQCAGGVALTRCYVLTATPVGSQLGDTACTSFTLSSAGAKAATGPSAATCW